MRSPTDESRDGISLFAETGPRFLLDHSEARWLSRREGQLNLQILIDVGTRRLLELRPFLLIQLKVELEVVTAVGSPCSPTGRSCSRS